MRRLICEILIRILGFNPHYKTLDNSLYDLVSFANGAVPFFYGKFTSILQYSPDNFAEKFKKQVPVTDKTSFKKAGKAILADFYRTNFEKLWFKFDDSLFRNLYKALFQKDFLFSVATGGTTGMPLTTYKNKKSLLADAVLFLRGWRMMGWHPGDKVLWFYHSYYDDRYSFMNTLSILTGIKLFFFESAITEDVMEKFIDELNKFKPSIVVTFPSYINDVAAYIIKKKIPLNHVPKGIDVSGEPLMNHQRINIEKAFNTKVYDGYGAMEFGMAAHECRFQTGMHIYEDMVLLESVNDGVDTNCIVATRFDSREVPIIRYKVGDRGSITKGVCQCGFSGSSIENVEGRLNDFIQFSNGQKLYPLNLRIFIDNCNDEVNGAIMDSSLVQKTPDDLDLLVVASSPEVQSKIKHYLTTEIRKHLPLNVIFNVLFVDAIRGGKKFNFINKQG